MSERIVYHDGNVLPNAGTACDAAEGKTRQSEADQADINKILKRFEKSGILPITERQGVFVDVSEIGDYRSALDAVSRADEYFMGLPADVRAKFNNDPALLLDAMLDLSRRDELVGLGILEKKPVETPKAPVVPTPPAG